MQGICKRDFPLEHNERMVQDFWSAFLTFTRRGRKEGAGPVYTEAQSRDQPHAGHHPLTVERVCRVGYRKRRAACPSQKSAERNRDRGERGEGERGGERERERERDRESERESERAAGQESNSYSGGT
eukprot:5320009-Pyramimonas_sp.AAC.1